MSVKKENIYLTKKYTELILAQNLDVESQRKCIWFILHINFYCWIDKPYVD